MRLFATIYELLVTINHFPQNSFPNAVSWQIPEWSCRETILILRGNNNVLRQRHKVLREGMAPHGSVQLDNHSCFVSSSHCREGRKECSSLKSKHTQTLFSFSLSLPTILCLSLFVICIYLFLFLSLFIFILFSLQFQYKLKKAQMVCLGFEPGAAGW